MKKISLFFSALALVATTFSCQKVDIDSNTEITGKPLKVTAYIDGNIETRMTYEVNANNTITPSWENGDEVFGFDSNGNTFTFTVTRSGNSEAELSVPSTYTPAAGTKVYAIFAPDYDSSMISNNQLEVDLSVQGGVLNPDANGTPFPALMCATGEVVANADINEIELHFTNQTAIIGVKKFQLFGSTMSHAVTSMTLDGVITTGTFEVIGGNLVLTPGLTTGSITATGTWNTDTDGFYETGVYFAAIPATDAHMSLSASTASATYNHVGTVNANSIVAGNYYYMSKKLSAEYVAQIGNDKYTTIDAAWAAANASPSDVTVTLLADCAAASSLTLNSNGSGAITLDLNGCNLSSAYQIMISNGRSLSVTDESSSAIEAQGAITSSCTNHALYVNASTLNFSGGTLSNPGVEKYPLYLYGASTATISGGLITADSNSTVYIASSSNVTVTAGSVTNTSPNTSHRVFHSYGQLTISGGIFTSNGGAVINSIGASGRADVGGGYFTRLSDGEIFIINTSNNVNGKCYVYGGYMNKPVNSSRTAYYDGTTAYQRSQRLNPDTDTKDDYPFQVGNYNRYYQTMIGSTTYRHSTLSSAAKHASISTSDITISPTGNRTGVGDVTLNNENGHTITLDLNNYSLSTSNGPLITTSRKLIVTDSSADKGGKIKTSSTYIVSVTGTSADVTISNCTFESTNSTARDTYTYPAVVCIYDSNTTGRTASKVTISSAKIYTANALTAVSNRNGNLEITDSEISSGVTGTGLVGVSTGNNVTGHTDDAPITIINSGSFYCSNTQGTRPAVYLYGSASSVTIHGGYFYSEGTRSIRASSPDLFVNITVNGGYYNKALDYPASGSTASPNYGPGLSCQSISPEVTYEHSQKGTLSFGYKVMATPSQSNASASPASYGSPRNGGVNFTNR